MEAWWRESNSGLFHDTIASRPMLRLDLALHLETIDRIGTKNLGSPFGRLATDLERPLSIRPRYRRVPKDQSTERCGASSGSVRKSTSHSRGSGERIAPRRHPQQSYANLLHRLRASPAESTAPRPPCGRRHTKLRIPIHVLAVKSRLPRPPREGSGPAGGEVCPPTHPARAGACGRPDRTTRPRMDSPTTEQPNLDPENFRGVGRNEACPCGSGRKFKNCHWDQLRHQH